MLQSLFDKGTSFGCQSSMASHIASIFHYAAVIGKKDTFSELPFSLQHSLYAKWMLLFSHDLGPIYIFLFALPAPGISSAASEVALELN